MLYRLNTLLTLAVLLLIVAVSPATQANQLPTFDPLSQPDFASNGSFGTEEPEFLPVEQAFIFNFDQAGEQVEVTFDIADTYYLYQTQFKFATEKASIADVQLPPGLDYYDEYYGDTQIYKKQVKFTIPVNFALEGGVIKLRYQGCAEAGLCYPPSVHEILLTPVNADGAPLDLSGTEFDTSESGLSSALQSDNILITLGLFFALGLALAFTPCVFPMYPILSSIIVGQGQMTSKQAFTFSLIYVQGMALTYSLLGLVVASAGAGFQAALQSPAVLIGMSILFVTLAISMFGAFELQLPSSWMNKLNNINNKQQGGNYKSALIMGVLSGLIASPCTTAPLSGALLYVAQTGDMLLGFTALYILSLGMGLPLLLIGSSASKWLPKAGGWMVTVKKGFGFILLAVPLMLMMRFVDELIVLWSSVALAASCALYFAYAYVKQNGGKLSVIFSVVAAVVAVLLTLQSSRYEKVELPFVQVQTQVELDAQIAQAIQNEQAVMLDITAEWCTGCKEFEHLTFANAEVQSQLSDIVWLQLDVTDYNKDHDQMIKDLGIVGPPAPSVLLFDEQGNEARAARIRGFLPPQDFIDAVQAAF